MEAIESRTPAKTLKVTRYEGEGQGTCARCLAKSGWNRYWMTMLYKVDGLPGLYCSQCVEQLRQDTGCDSISVVHKN